MNSMYIASIVYVQTALFGYINSYPDYTLIILRMRLQNKISFEAVYNKHKVLHVPSMCVWSTKQEKGFV